MQYHYHHPKMQHSTPRPHGARWWSHVTCVQSKSWPTAHLFNIFTLSLPLIECRSNSTVVDIHYALVGCNVLCTFKRSQPCKSELLTFHSPVMVFIKDGTACVLIFSLSLSLSRSRSRSLSRSRSRSRSLSLRPSSVRGWRRRSRHWVTSRPAALRTKVRWTPTWGG